MIKQLVNIKILATILCLVVAGLHEHLLACSAFSIPYALAVMFDDTISKEFGIFIVVSLGIYTVAWIIAPILLGIKTQSVYAIGIFITIALNLCDAVCCFLSLLEFLSIPKVINMVFTAVIILIAYRAWDGLREP